MTSGGIMGKIVKTTEEFIVVQVSESVELTFQRASVAQLLPKGTLDGIRQ